jgi:hypothetical protein
MSSATRAFRPALHAPETAVSEVGSASLADLIRMMAESIADAQVALDRSAAELVAELAQTRVPVVPSITETIGADGSISYSTAKPQMVSLLELGVRPTFYQFSQATLEVSMDMKLVEQLDERGQRRSGSLGLFADTASVRFERKLQRDVQVHSKITATLVPVPAPLRLDIPRRTQGASE